MIKVAAFNENYFKELISKLVQLQHLNTGLVFSTLCQQSVHEQQLIYFLYECVLGSKMKTKKDFFEASDRLLDILSL
jgi:hypothetical protein